MAEMSDGATSYASSVFASSNLASHNHTTHATPKVVTKKPAVPNYFRKLMVGSIVSISSAVCFVGLTEFMRAMYTTAKFEAPFFIVYFSTTWWVVVYPVYVCARTVATVGRPGLKNSFKEGFSVYGKEGASPRPTAVLGKVAMFTCLWVFSCYSFLRALSLKKLYYVDVVALFASKSAFVFLMSWIILQKQFLAMRIVAFIVAMIGISIITYMRVGSNSSDMWGAIMAIVATAGAACYKVLFKRFFGAANACQISMFLSCLGIFNMVGMLPVLALCYFTNFEPMAWTTMPWPLLCGVAGYTFAITVLQMYTEQWTYPWLLQVTFILAIPLSAAAEMIFNARQFKMTSLQIIAYVLIVLSFPLNMLPRDWHDRLFRTMRWQCLQNAVGSAADDGSVGNVNAAHVTPRQRLRTSQA